MIKHAAYVPVIQAVKTAQVLESARFEGSDFVEAQVKLASVAHDGYASLRAAADRLPTVAGLGTKEAAAARVVDLVMQLRGVHADLGTKVASDGRAVAECMQKLAAAVIVDSFLEEQLSMLEGDVKLSALATQALGREFAMGIVGALLA